MDLLLSNLVNKSIWFFSNLFNPGFILQSHCTLELFVSYFLKVQFLSHKERFLLLNSFFLSYIVISVSFSVVYLLHLLL